MNVLRHFLNRQVHLRHHRHLAGTGGYTTALQIEPECQDALEALVGGRSSEGAQHECTAFLVPEPEDLDLPGSVAVHVAGYKVGSLIGTEGERYRRFPASTGRSGVALCDARITGGWLREEGEG